jgi:oligosaccharide amylase
MPQSLVLGNGNLLTHFGSDLQMRDCYYPYVGQENHSAFGSKHRIGFWVNGTFAWLDHDSWDINIDYEKRTLVGNSIAKNNLLGIEVHFQDFVYTTHDILFRRLTIKNLTNTELDVRVFYAHDFYLYGDKLEDTALFDPEFHAVLHYRKQRYFLVNGQWETSKKGLSEFAVGKSCYGKKEGTWRDAEDGHLGGNPIEQGSVDSVVGFYENFRPEEEKKLNLWLVAGKNIDAIKKNNTRVLKMGVQRIHDHTAGYWSEWCQKSQSKLHGVTDEMKEIWYQSLLMIRTQTDNRGAIIASNDSDIQLFNKDTYCYMWPRDGALVSVPLSKKGYGEVVRKFLFFCEKIIAPEGYVMNKFTPDGSLGSSWHPKYKDGKIQLPIQEDESALILYAMNQYYKNSQTIEVVQELFNSVVLKIAGFLMSYIDPKTGLPLQSYDLWEEQRGVFSYTSSTVYAGLDAAADLAKATGHYHAEERFRTAAKKMQKAIIKQLYSQTHKRFVKRLTVNEKHEYVEDTVIDASLAFVWELGVLPADDERVVNTMQAIEKNLTVTGGGIARYQDDYYHRDYNQPQDKNYPGNPWIITTLWLANWYIELAKTKKDLQKPLDLIQWCADRASSAKILPEQNNPFTGEPLSVAPLTWSHSTYVDTVLRYSEKWESLN